MKLEIGTRVQGYYSNIPYEGVIREYRPNGVERYIVQLDKPVIIVTKRSALCVELSSASLDTINPVP
jgi:hypothetical protein